jgi:apolipoprotein N-acyltransferase
MKLHAAEIKNLFLATLSPILLMLSFPPYNLTFLVWISLVPLFYLIFRINPRYSVFYMIYSGILYYVLLMGWVQRFHYLSVPFISTVSGTLYFALPLYAGRHLNMVFNRFSCLFLVPSVWIIAEYIKTSFFLSFGFGVLGYSLHDVPLLIQFADITGVSGVSFLIVMGNYALYSLAEDIMRKGKITFTGPVPGTIPVFFGILLTVVIYGGIRLTGTLSEKNLTIRMVQTDHQRKGPWLNRMDEYLEEYRGFAEQDADASIDLIIFPENSVKTFFSLQEELQPPGSREVLNRLSGIAREKSSYLLINGLEVEKKNRKVRKYNTALLFDPGGNISGRYRKNILVPFGETDPFRNLLPTVDRMILNDTDAMRFSRGFGTHAVKVKNKTGKAFRAGIAICFEGTDSRLIKEYPQRGADFLINITNDRWTGSRDALLQHAQFSVFRAIENRMAVYRVGNGGLTVVIDPMGRMKSRLPLFTSGIIDTKLIKTESSGSTIYSRFGNWFVLFSFVLLSVYYIWERFKTWNQR